MKTTLTRDGNESQAIIVRRLLFLQWLRLEKVLGTKKKEEKEVHRKGEMQEREKKREK